MPRASSRTRAISPLVIDGYTSLVLYADERNWRRELRSLFSTGGRGRRVSVWFEGAPQRFAEATLSPMGQRLTLHFWGSAFITFDIRTGRIEIQARAESLWADGFESWFESWAPWISTIAGVPGARDKNAWDLPLKIHRLELCCDFVGFPIKRSDAGCFSTKARSHVIESSRKGERVDTYGRCRPEVETITLGSRTGRTSMAIYDKTNQLMSTRGLRPENSFYAVQWSLSSDFTPGALITRVELRLSAHGLCFRDDDGALLDLTEPRALLNPVNLATLWKSETARRRLLRPGSGRPSRRPIDPRWKVVQDAAGAGTPKIRLFQARDVRRLTHWEALARCERTLLRTGQSYAALCGEPTLESMKLELRNHSLHSDAVG